MEAQPDDGLLSVLDGALSGLRRARSELKPRLAGREFGVVRTVASGIARVSGLPNVGFQELVQFREVSQESHSTLMKKKSAL